MILENPAQTVVSARLNVLLPKIVRLDAQQQVLVLQEPPWFVVESRKDMGENVRGSWLPRNQPIQDYNVVTGRDWVI